MSLCDIKGEGNLKCIAFSFSSSMHAQNEMGVCVCIWLLAHFLFCCRLLSEKKTRSINLEENYYVIPKFNDGFKSNIFNQDTSFFNYMVMVLPQFQMHGFFFA